MLVQQAYMIQLFICVYGDFTALFILDCITFISRSTILVMLRYEVSCLCPPPPRLSLVQYNTGGVIPWLVSSLRIHAYIYTSTVLAASMHLQRH